MRWRGALAVALAIACNSGAESSSDATSTSETGSGGDTEIDPGYAALLSCGPAAWARVDTHASVYTRVRAQPGGGSVVSGEVTTPDSTHGVVHRRDSAAVLAHAILGDAPFGSARELVDANDRYVVAATDFVDETCEDGPYGPLCDVVAEHWLRAYDPDDTLAWELGPASAPFRVLGLDATGRTIVANNLEVRAYGPSGALDWSTPAPEATVLTTLAVGGGYFAYRYLSPPGVIARLSADFEVVWELDPMADFNIEGALAPSDSTLFASTPDGGVAIAGNTLDPIVKQRVIRLSAEGLELWRADFEHGTVLQSTLATGPGGEVGFATSKNSAGWLRVFAADGAPSRTIECQASRQIRALAIDANGLLIAGRTSSTGQAFIAGYSWDQ